MNNIIEFINKIKTEGLGDVLSNPSFWPDIEKAQAQLKTMDGQEKENAQKSLEDIIQMIDKEIMALNTQKDVVQVELKNMSQRQEACISYLKGSTIKGK